jgi:hypothetical protein
MHAVSSKNEDIESSLSLIDSLLVVERCEMSK